MGQLWLSWGHLGAILGYLGAILGPSWVILAPSESHLVLSWGLNLIFEGPPRRFRESSWALSRFRGRPLL